MIPRITTDDLPQIRNELAKRSLAEFCKQAWHVLEPSTPLKWGWVFDALAEHLQAVTEGEIQNLLINVPPGTMKSLMTSVFWPAWEWGPRGMGSMRYVATSHAERLAIRDNRRCRSLIASEWFQSRWPLPLVSDQNEKKRFENSATGFRAAMAFTGMTGDRGDRVILDDPISAHHANSQAHIEAAEIAFTETLPTRVNNDESSVIVIMQRLAERDVSGLILDRGLDYEHVMIPMRFEEDRRCSTSIGWTDPRTVDGELMAPDRFPEAQVAELEKTLGPYAVAGQLQQRPAPRGGALFKTEMFERVSPDDVPNLAYRFITADTALTNKTYSDFSVFSLWGWGKDKRLYLLDVLRGKWEVPQMEIAAEAFWRKHAVDPDKRHRLQFGNVRDIAVENKASGIGLIQRFRQKRIPVKAIERERDKVSRALDATPVLAVSPVRVVDGPFADAFISECLGFSPTGAGHDDQVDTLMDAVERTSRGGLSMSDVL